MRFIHIGVMAVLLVVLGGKAYAACTDPAGVIGEMIYNQDYKVMQYCDDTNWIAMAGGGVLSAEGTGGSIQYKASDGGLAGSSGLIWNDTTKQLMLTTALGATGLRVSNGSAVVFDMKDTGSQTGVVRFATYEGVNYLQTSASETPASFQGLAIGAYGQTLEQSKLFIANSGNVGIGTHTPTQKLDVNGTVKATNFVGNLNGMRFLSGYATFAHNSCGNAVATPCNINISSGGFTSVPHCVITTINKDATSYREHMVIQDTTTTWLRIWRGTFHSGEGTTMQVNWMCMGPG